MTIARSALLKHTSCGTIVPSCFDCSSCSIFNSLSNASSFSLSVSALMRSFIAKSGWCFTVYTVPPAPAPNFVSLQKSLQHASELSLSFLPLIACSSPISAVRCILGSVTASSILSRLRILLSDLRVMRCAIASYLSGKKSDVLLVSFRPATGGCEGTRVRGCGEISWSPCKARW